MKKNLGKGDKIVRFILALALVVLLVTHTIAGTTGVMIGWVVVAILAMTALDGTCPLYSLLGISTCPKKKPSA